MKTLKYIILFAPIIFSCDPQKAVETVQEYKELNDNVSISIEIISKIGGEKGSFYYVFEEDQNKQKTRFIELNVIGSSMLRENRSDTFSVASYCACQLHKKLPKDVIDANTGYNIIFDNKRDLLHRKKYFFTKPDLDNVLKSFQTIDDYLMKIGANDTIKAFSLIDTTYFAENFSQLNKMVSKRLEKGIIEVNYFYNYYDLNSQKSNLTYKCLKVIAVVKNKDNIDTPINFLTLVNSGKIINLDPK